MNAFRLVLIIAALSACACSTTPGDAAASSNHPAQAADLYRRGADQGDAGAAFKLARLIASGAFHDSSYGSAGDWYIRACDLGEMVGCHNAGVASEYAQFGIELNYEKARTYYLRAAESGYMQSQYNLGSLYANQYFPDSVEGLAWLLAAQEKARRCLPDPLCKWVTDDPPHHLATLRSRMTGEEVSTSEALAKALTVGK